jgi:hypothetical protein
LANLKLLILMDRMMVSELPLPDERSGRDHAVDGAILNLTATGGSYCCACAPTAIFIFIFIYRMFPVTCGCYAGQ